MTPLATFASAFTIIAAGIFVAGIVFIVKEIFAPKSTETPTYVAPHECRAIREASAIIDECWTEEVQG